MGAYHQQFHITKWACLVKEVDQLLATRDETLRQVKANLHAANNRMQQVVNSKRRELEFQEGDWVFLKLHPYCQ